MRVANDLSLRVKGRVRARAYSVLRVRLRLFHPRFFLRAGRTDGKMLVSGGRRKGGLALLSLADARDLAAKWLPSLLAMSKA